MRKLKLIQNISTFIISGGLLLMGIPTGLNAQLREGVYPEKEKIPISKETSNFEVADMDALIQNSVISLSGLQQISVRDISMINQKSETIYLVENTNDSGPGSLRWAIEQANAGDGGIINFNIPGTPPFVIQPTLDFPLPQILKPVTIDGTTQPQYAPGAPVIVLDGTVIDVGPYIPPDPNNPSTPSGHLGVNGLDLRPGSDGSLIKGLVIINYKSGTEDYAGFNGMGISVLSNNNVFESNFIGIQHDGVTPGPNLSGIVVEASNSIIGGENPENRNIISGNTSGGISLAQYLVGGFGNPVENNLVIGNYVGTNAAGTAAVPNNFNITIGRAGAFNTVKNNLISGGTIIGIQIQMNANNNIIEGNLIGTNLNGTGPVANQFGIRFLSSSTEGPSNNIIGGNTADSRNIISGNNWGIYGQGSNNGKILNNQIKGNYIGTNLTGTASLPNQSGIAFVGHATENIIGGSLPGEGNLISGNTSTGIIIFNVFAENTDNLIEGNLIGTNAEGNQAIPNGFSGIQVEGSGNIIGGTDPSKRNIISGNGQYGARIIENNITVEGNYIGTDVTGTIGIGNGISGLSIEEATNINVIGNVISFNGRSGASGSRSGLRLIQSTSIVIQSNKIGTDHSGNNPLGNGLHGVYFEDSQNNLFGGSDQDSGNTVSGNLGAGVTFYGISYFNTIEGNLIGTNSEGTQALGNNGIGMLFWTGQNQIRNNVVSGNGTTSSSAGISIAGVESVAGNNILTGNKVGTDVTGSLRIANSGGGIVIRAPKTIVGGTNPGDGNIISGNTGNGIIIVPIGYPTYENQILGNYIGTNPEGATNLGNTFSGISIDGSSNNLIGNAEESGKNLIAYNSQHGIRLVILDFGGQINIPLNNSILANSIHSNTLLGISLGSNIIPPNDADDADTGPNNLQNFPEISQASVGSGQLNVSYFVPSLPGNSAYPIRVEFFSTNPNERQGKTFLGFDEFTASDYSDGSKSVTIDLPAGVNLDPGNQLTATATDANGNTSHFGTLVESEPGVEVYTLTLQANPEEGGTVSGAGDYDDGTVVTVNAVPAEGYFFVNWTDLEDNVISVVPQNDITITGDLTLIANFELVPPEVFTLTLLANPEEGGFVTGAGDYEDGTVVAVNAVPAEGYFFVNWTDLEDSVISVIPQNDITITGDLTLIANFELVPPDVFTLTLLANPEEGGFVTGAGNYEDGTVVTVNAVPAEGYFFVNWTDLEDNVISVVPQNDITITGDLTLIANFELVPPDVFTLTLLANPEEGGFVTGAGDYEDGTVVAVNAVPAEGYFFVNWTDLEDNVISVIPQNDITITGDLTLIANFELVPPDVFTLTLLANPEEGGFVTGAGNYEDGTVVTVNAVPAEGYFFVNWTDLEDNVISVVPQNDITITGDLTLIANFELVPPDVFTLTLLANPEEGGFVTGAGNYEDGTVVTVNAVPADGYFFVNWTDLEDNVISVVPQNDITLTNDLTLIANFELVPPEVFTLTLLANPEEGGFVTGAGDYEDGTVVTVNAVPAEGYFFVNWTDLEDNVISVVPQNDITLTSDLTLIANFELVPPEVFTLTLLANPEEGGFVTGAGDYEDGTVVTVNAVPADGYFFVNWTDLEDNVISVVPQNDITLTSDLTLIANFELVPPEVFTLTLLANPEEGGFVTGAGDYEDGTVVAVNAVPAEGYFFVNWTDLEDNVISVIPQNDITITGDLTLIANFELVPPDVFTLTLLANPEEGGFVTGAGNYEDGTVVTVNAVPAEGYFFVNWTDLEDNVISVVPQNDITLTSDLTLIANFELVPPEVFTLTLLANPEEGGFVTGAGDYEDGTVVAVNAVPAEGYFFVNWTDLEDNVISVIPQNDITITGDLTLIANFELVPPEVFTLTLLANPEEGGFVTGAGDYEDGTVVTVNAVPADGYFFVNWTDLEDNVISVVPQNDITITGDLTLIANFELVPPEVFTLTLLANPEEGGFVTGAGNYEDGTVVTVNAVPAEGYFFVNWTDLEDNVISVVPQNDITLTSDLTLIANFELVPPEVFTLTLLANPEEGGFVTGAGDYDDGTVVTVNAVPADGYFFVNWTDLEDNVISVVPQNDITLTSDLTLIANFMEMAEDVLCSYSQGYWFARPQTVWPYDVEVGGWTFTQQDGQAFWPPNNNTRRAFTQYATIYLSGVTVSLFPELQEAMETIEYYFENVYPAMADRHVNRAAGFIGNWVDANHCDNTTAYSAGVNYDISMNQSDEQTILRSSEELRVIAYPNPFRKEAIIEFTPVASSDATIEIFNIVGEKVRVLFEGPVNAFETYQVKLESRDLPNGIYFYHLKTGDKSYIDKLILAK